MDSSSKQHDYFASPAEAHDAALERAWVEGISTGDVTAFESMFSAYKSDLGAFVESYVHSREAAEDIIQDLFLRIWKQRHVWDLSVPLNVYLFRAARNGGISYLRHQRVEARFRERIAIEEPVPGMQGFGVGADAGAEEHELEAAIERAVAELPIRCREVFRLNRYHHLSYADVARVLQISVKTVEVQMGRALIFLRKRLAEWRD